MERFLYRLSKSKYKDNIVLKGALEATFKNREFELPSGEDIFPEIFFQKNSVKQVQWKSFVLKNSLENAPEEFAEVVRDIEVFMKGILFEIHS